METLGLGQYFEDLPVGRQFKTIGRTITESDLINYINCIGLLEVLFTNQEFRKKESDIDGQFVPGMLVHGFAEGLLTQAVMQTTGFAFLSMELNIETPTFVGDTIHVEVEVIEARLSKSRPHRGLIRTHNKIYNQSGKCILTYTPLRMIKCRSGVK